MSSSKGDFSVRKVSIAITTFNRAHLVARAVRSALAQISLGLSLEIIVVDDGSDDGTSTVLESFGDNITVIRLDENRGVGVASQVALDKCSGEYFVRLDSDDYLAAGFCFATVPILATNPTLSLVSSDLLMIDDDERSLWIESRQSSAKFLEYGAGVLSRAEVLREVGGYPPLRLGEDRQLFTAILDRGFERFHLPVPYYRRRIHSGNLSAGRPGSRESVTQ